MKNKNSNNPWLGLKTYEEGQVIYGRTDDINALSQNIIFNVQTVIYGKSGIGKSSILNAGVFPILRRSHLFPVNIRLIHNQPDKSYNSQIWECVTKSLLELRKERLASDGTKEIIKGVNGRYEVLVPPSGHESLWEMFHRHKFYDDAGECILPVLVFDQFEEIFTREKDTKKVAQFFNELADLINNVMPDELCNNNDKDVATEPQAVNDDVILDGIFNNTASNYLIESKFHVVLAIREDYLFYLERNIANIPSLKHNRYCLLPLNEEQAASVIMEPSPGLVSKDVAKEIISKVTGVDISAFELDDEPELEVDSAILSLFLSEIYKKKADDERVIKKELVLESGKNIIQDFYERTISNVSEDFVDLLEEKLITDGRRDSVFVSKIANTKLKKKELNYLVEQRLLREFPWNDGMRVEFIHDILCSIIVGRIEKKKLKKEAELLLQEEERQRKEKERQAKENALKSQNKRLLSGLLATFIGVVLFALFFWDGMYREIPTRYGDITTRYGWVVGLEKLSKNEALHRSCHYVIIHKGRWSKHPCKVEARDGYDKLTTSHMQNEFILSQINDTKGIYDGLKDSLEAVCQWELVKDDAGEALLQERAYTRHNSLVYSYNHSIISNKNIVSNYVDELGFPILFGDSSYVYMLTEMNDEGYNVKTSYYDNNRGSIVNKYGAFITRREFFDNGVAESEASLFLNGSMMIDSLGNCGWKALERSDDGYQGTLYVCFDADKRPCRMKDNVMFKKKDYDEYGRAVKISYWCVDEKYLSIDVDSIKILLEKNSLTLLPDTNDLGFHGYMIGYNNHGKYTKYYPIGKDGNIVEATNPNWFSSEIKYDDEGNVIYFINTDSLCSSLAEYKYDTDGKMVYKKEYVINAPNDTLVNELLYEEKGVTKSFVYNHNDGTYIYREYDKRDRKVLEATYNIADNAPVGERDQMHKEVVEYVDNGDKSTIITYKYYNKNNEPCRYVNGVSSWKEVYVIDSVNHTKTCKQYTTNNVRMKGYEPDADFEDIPLEGCVYKCNPVTFMRESEVNLDSDGVECRDFVYAQNYYEMKYVKPLSPRFFNYNGCYFINEFGEPCIGLFAGRLCSIYFNDKYYDEYGNPIDYDYSPLFMITIDENPALGFRSGDILVQQDNWVMREMEDDAEPTAFIDGLEVPSTDDSHVFKVLRFNKEKKDYELVVIDVPAGEEELIYVGYTKFYCTKNERERVYAMLRRLNL